MLKLEIGRGKNDVKSEKCWKKTTTCIGKNNNNTPILKNKNNNKGEREEGRGLLNGIKKRRIHTRLQ